MFIEAFVLAKIALFGKALFLALVCGALAMCAMCMGFSIFFSLRFYVALSFFSITPNGLFSQPLKTHHSVDNQLVNIYIVCLNLQANKYLSQKACRYGWKTR